VVCHCVLQCFAAWSSNFLIGLISELAFAKFRRCTQSSPETMKPGRRRNKAAREVQAAEAEAAPEDKADKKKRTADKPPGDGGGGVIGRGRVRKVSAQGGTQGGKEGQKGWWRGCSRLGRCRGRAGACHHQAQQRQQGGQKEHERSHHHHDCRQRGWAHGWRRQECARPVDLMVSWVPDIWLKSRELHQNRQMHIRYITKIFIYFARVCVCDQRGIIVSNEKYDFLALVSPESYISHAHYGQYAEGTIMGVTHATNVHSCILFEYTHFLCQTTPIPYFPPSYHTLWFHDVCSSWLPFSHTHCAQYHPSMHLCSDSQFSAPAGWPGNSRSRDFMIVRFTHLCFEQTLSVVPSRTPSFLRLVYTSLYTTDLRWPITQLICSNSNMVGTAAPRLSVRIIRLYCSFASASFIRRLTWPSGFWAQFTFIWAVVPDWLPWFCFHYFVKNASIRCLDVRCLAGMYMMGWMNMGRYTPPAVINFTHTYCIAQETQFTQWRIRYILLYWMSTSVLNVQNSFPHSPKAQSSLYFRASTRVSASTRGTTTEHSFFLLKNE